MLRERALAAATAGVLVLATGAVSLVALSGVRILGLNASSSASAVPVVSGGPASVLIVNKKHVVTRKGAPGQPDATVVVDATLPPAPEVVDPGTGAPLVVRSAAAPTPADGPVAPDDTTSTLSDSQPPASPASGSSGVSPARPTPTPSAAATATTAKPATDTTAKPATATSATTAAPATTTTTAAPITTATTAAPAVTTTNVAAPGLFTSTGQAVPTSWQVSSSYLRSGQPIPPYPTSCRKGQLEDNGKWNCG